MEADLASRISQTISMKFWCRANVSDENRLLKQWNFYSSLKAYFVKSGWL